MDPIQVTQRRVGLRDKYKEAVGSIIGALQRQSKPAYTHAELAAQFRVHLQPFDPADQRFIDSEACLFQPLSMPELEEFKIDENRELTKDEDRYLHHFNDTFNDFPKDHPVSEDRRMYERAGQILFYLEVFESMSEKKEGRHAFSIEDYSYWVHIKADDSFCNTPSGMLSGIRLGHSKPKELPKWRAASTCQWLDEDLKTTRPHVKLLTQTAAKARENELLHGELGPIANAIQCRLNQPEFENTSLFPVLVISLFGPRHGRLLHARFNDAGTLNVRCSPIYSFVEMDKERMDLLVRYNNCSPRDGVEFEPILADVALPSTPYVQDQASLLGSDKENLPPQK